MENRELEWGGWDAPLRAVGADHFLARAAERDREAGAKARHEAAWARLELLDDEERRARVEHGYGRSC